MLNEFNKTKSNHMLEYYRKQSNKRMIESIISMKSDLQQNFTLQKHKKKAFLNKNKREMQQTLKKQQIYEKNKKMVYRIKQIRQKTMKDNLKYMDDRNYKRLIQTRNQFRSRVRNEKQSKMCDQNEKILKRLLNTKSQYNLPFDGVQVNKKTIKRNTFLQRNLEDNSNKNQFNHFPSEIQNSQERNNNFIDNIKLNQYERMINDNKYRQILQEQQIKINRKQSVKKSQIKKRAKTQMLQRNIFLEKIYCPQLIQYSAKITQPSSSVYKNGNKVKLGLNFLQNDESLNQNYQLEYQRRNIQKGLKKNLQK